MEKAAIPKNIKYYLVGGAVRDQLLGLQVTERDWLVTGASAEELTTMGFRQVGRDFPVFLHPETAEEYALPRGECNSSDEQALIAADLIRRDLTINAMALGQDGELIDPLAGRRDLEQRLLRHTPSFDEDPIRVLRLARFAARFHALGFTVAEETKTLVKEMVKRGRLNSLIPERVWAEIQRALTGDHPWIFFETLRLCNALHPLLPELHRLYGVPQPPQHHPEVDTGIHSMMVLKQACRLSSDPKVRFAALLHDLGKGTTPKDIWPRHIGHEERGVWHVTELCARLRTPNSYRDLAIGVARYHTHAHKACELRSSTLWRVIQGLDGLRRPQQFELFLLACEADFRGRLGFEEKPYPQADLLRRVRQAASDVAIAALVQQKPQDLPAQIERLRIEAIDAEKRAWDTRQP